MQGEGVKSRFGRCPYCRAMIYQDLTAIIFYCSKCRSPIRGKNPRPADETEYALAQLEILSADTASVFSDDVDPPPPDPRSAWSVHDDDDGRPPPASRSTAGTGAASSSSAPYREFASVGEGPRGRSAPNSGLNRYKQTELPWSGSPLRSRVTELRPSSRRTRHSSSGDVGAGSGTDDSDPDAPPAATSHRRRRASPLGSQELEVASVLSGLEAMGIERSPLSDPAFQKDLLQALDNLRKLIAAVDHPRSIDGHWHGVTMAPRLTASCNNASNAGGERTITRRSSRLMRRLESQLSRAALPAERHHRRDASASSASSYSSSTASSSRRGGVRAGAHHCRPLMGGTPFVVCGECSEVLQLPATLPAGRMLRIKCGGCGEAFELTLPASGGSSTTDRPNRIFSAPQPAVGGGEEAEENAALAWSNLSGEQPRPAGPLHRVLGYSSVSSVLRSRRYSELD
ncbi:unnamed protein product [Urochloa decumbens]|uniref:Probable zinc-ribbon domain-containing protein n=1 Tax=Urochloa decumbens TaxID=240449 RepID=A0ABC8Z3U5_9POAL